MKRIFLLIVILVQFFITFNMALAEKITLQAPKNSFYVQDYADVMIPEAKERINRVSSELQQKTKAQICVVTVRTIGETPIKEYANELFREWKIGDKELNNGVLLLVAIDDRIARIEVGYGLEGAISDATAGNILREEIFPYFKNEKYGTSKYNAGIMKGYYSLVDKVAKEYKVTIDTAPKIKDREEEKREKKVEYIVTGIVMIIGAFYLYRKIKNNNGGSGGTGGKYERDYSSTSSSSSNYSSRENSGSGGSSGGGGADGRW